VAVPVGTTSRQIEWLARWLLAAVVILGMLAWWWPGFRSWGNTGAGLAVGLALWLLWRTVSGDRTVPGHPFHLVMVVPGAILTGHLAVAGMLSAEGYQELTGELNMSMIFQLALLSLGVMLSQSLLPKAARHTVLLGVCAAAMMGGPALAMSFGQGRHVRTALALLAFGGVGVWLSMLWGLGRSEDAPPDRAADPSLHRLLRIGCIAVAAAAACGLAAVAPRQAVAAAGVVAVVLILGGLVFPGRRKLVLAVGGSLLVAAAAALTATGWVHEVGTEIVTKTAHAGLFGRGEQAFRDVSAADSGLVVLAATAGWIGVGSLAGGLVVCMVWLLSHARRGRSGDRGRAILWSSASALVACAFLSGGGPSIPAVTLAVALVWGLLPTMLGRPRPIRSGAWLAGATVVVVVLAALTPKSGLLSWMTQVFGAGDKFLHASIGFLLGIEAAWLFGSRRLWLGLSAIAAAALAGGLGEAVQHLVGTRTPDYIDWLFHAAGAAAAFGPYLLCVGARWAESPDAKDNRAAEAYLRR